MKSTIQTGIVVLIWASVIAVGYCAGHDTLNLKPIYPPRLDRPALRPKLRRLPHDAFATSPAHDGDIFYMEVHNAKTAKFSPQLIRGVVDSVLAAYGWDNNPPNEDSLEETIYLPPVDSAFLEAELATGLEESTDQLTKRFGSLSPNTIQALSQFASERRDYARRAQRVCRFRQRFNGYPIEMAEIDVQWMEERGIIGISGRIFKDVNLVNRGTLTGMQALALGKSYVAKATGAIPVEGMDTVLIIMPYQDAMRYVWRFTITSRELPYQMYLDAQSGSVLKLLPLFRSATPNAKGLVFTPNPDAGVRLEWFCVNDPIDGKSELKLNGVLELENFGADGRTGYDHADATGTGDKTDMSVPCEAGNTADFTVAQDRLFQVKNAHIEIPNEFLNESHSGPSPDYKFPRIDTARRSLSRIGLYNSRFQEINAYAWVYRFIQDMKFRGWNKMPKILVLVNVNPNLYFVSDCSPPSDTVTLRFGIGNATVNKDVTDPPYADTMDCPYYNSACDATLILHEAGHCLNQSMACLPPATDEGLADFWSMSINGIDTIGGWTAQLREATVQTGFLPRSADCDDLFPEHLKYNDPAADTYDAHIDGQIICWALWSSQMGVSRLVGSDPQWVDDYAQQWAQETLIRTLPSIGGGDDATSPKDVHDSFWLVLKKFREQMDQMEYPHPLAIYKLLAGFARAGIFAEDRVAIIDIDQDFVADDSYEPLTFTIWSGRDYLFNGSKAIPSERYNPHYEITVAGDSDFTDHVHTSGTLHMGDAPVATWTLWDWHDLRGGDYLYYKLTTWQPFLCFIDVIKIHKRVSTHGQVPSAVINHNHPTE